MYFLWGRFDFDYIDVDAKRFFKGVQRTKSVMRTLAAELTRVVVP